MSRQMLDAAGERILREIISQREYLSTEEQAILLRRLLRDCQAMLSLLEADDAEGSPIRNSGARRAT